MKSDEYFFKSNYKGSLIKQFLAVKTRANPNSAGRTFELNENISIAYV